MSDWLTDAVGQRGNRMSKGEVANSIAAVPCGNQRISGRGKLVGTDHRLVGAFGRMTTREGDPLRCPQRCPLRCPQRCPQRCPKAFDVIFDCEKPTKNCHLTDQRSSCQPKDLPMRPTLVGALVGAEISGRTRLVGALVGA